MQIKRKVEMINLYKKEDRLFVKFTLDEKIPAYVEEAGEYIEGESDTMFVSQHDIVECLMAVNKRFAAKYVLQDAEGRLDLLFDVFEGRTITIEQRKVAEGDIVETEHGETVVEHDSIWNTVVAVH